MNEGGLIPYQLTVQVLVNALIEQPSKVSSSKNLLVNSTSQPSNRYLELSDRWLPQSCWLSYLLRTSCRRSSKRSLLQHADRSLRCEVFGTSQNQWTFWWHRRDYPQTSSNIQRAIDCGCGTLRKIRQGSLSWWKWWPLASLEANSLSNASLGKLCYWSSRIRQINS